MRKTELKDCPKWLLDAKTIDEDVDYNLFKQIVWHGGEWHGGVWRDGVWSDGEWRGGVWHGGVWHGGDSAIRSKWIILQKNNGLIKIGCKEKTVKEWDLFFENKEIFETKNDSIEYKMIFANYEALKKYTEILNK